MFSHSSLNSQATHVPLGIIMSSQLNHQSSISLSSRRFKSHFKPCSLNFQFESVSKTKQLFHSGAIYLYEIKILITKEPTYRTC